MLLRSGRCQRPHIFEESPSVAVEVFGAASAEQWRTHLIRDGAAEAPVAQATEKVVVANEAFAHRYRLNIRRDGLIIYHRSVVPEFWAQLVVCDGGVGRYGRHVFRSGVQLGLL